MAEWFKALVLKANVLKSTMGSNPILSLNIINVTFNCSFTFIRIFKQQFVG